MFVARHQPQRVSRVPASREISRQVSLQASLSRVLLNTGCHLLISCPVRTLHRIRRLPSAYHITMDAAYNAYTRYKSGTKVFTTWLVGAAGRAGHQSTPRWQRRDKIKKTPEKHLVPTHDFETLALCMIKSSVPHIEVPRSIWTVLPTL